MKLNLSLVGHQLYPGGSDHWFEGIRPDEIVRIAQRADELGFDQLRVGEHFVIPRDWVPTMGSRWADCVSTLAFIAGVTRRIRVASSIIVVPYHHPLMLAKQLATVDELSGGRLDFAASVGHLEGEFALLGVPYQERGARTDEFLDAIVELWTSDEPSFEGRFVSFGDLALDPRPVQDPYPPIWIGGHTKASARRAARIGDAWMPWGVSRADLPGMMELIRAQPGFAERTRPFMLYLDLYDRVIDAKAHDVEEGVKIRLERDAVLEQIHELHALGVTHTCVDPLLGYGHWGADLPKVRGIEEYLERLQWVAEEILPEASKLEPAAG